MVSNIEIVSNMLVYRYRIYFDYLSVSYLFRLFNGIVSNSIVHRYRIELDCSSVSHRTGLITVSHRTEYRYRIELDYYRYRIDSRHRIELDCITASYRTRLFYGIVSNWIVLRYRIELD